MADQDQILKDIGTRIRQARTAMRLSQRDLAAKVRVGQSNVSEVETGTAGDVRISTLLRFAEALDTTLAHLVSGDDVTGQPAEPTATEAAPPQVEVILAIPNHSITLKGSGSNRDVIADAVWALGEATAMVRGTEARIGQHL